MVSLYIKKCKKKPEINLRLIQFSNTLIDNAVF
jgi:hypothetical protein